MEILRKMMDQPYVEGAKKKGIWASIERKLTFAKGPCCKTFNSSSYMNHCNIGSIKH
jgi:hypothetical protein